MALLVLTATWARGAGFAPADVRVVTVDHRLRAESGAEAERVAAWVAARGHPHTILRREGPAFTRDIQAGARDARYDLMARWCAAIGVQDLLLGHHLEDQAETFLLRLARGSGVDGLSAMQAVAYWPAPAGMTGVRLLRPLLGFPKARLMATLGDADQAWIDDPSNRNPRFARARLRQSAPVLAREGLTPSRLAATARRMGRVRAALDAATADLLGASARFEPAGYCRVGLDAFRTAPEEIGLRALARILAAVGAEPYSPRLERLERLYAWVRGEGLGGGRTLAGCRIVGDGPAHILVVREPERVAKPLRLRPGQPAIWDGRFRVGWRGGEDTIAMGALGHAGWRQVRDAGSAPASVPAGARPTVPGFWRGEDLLAAPNIGFARAGCDAADFQSEFLPAGGCAPRG